MRRTTIALAVMFFAVALSQLAGRGLSQSGRPPEPVSRAFPPEKFAGGYVLERDADVAREEPGTHKGGGQTIGYSFFSKVPKLGLVFRKRALKPGSGIGLHEQKEDEIYYVLSGTGTMTLDGKTVNVTPGTAVLTRTGSSHSLRQTGSEDLVILINYEAAPPR